MIICEYWDCRGLDSASRDLSAIGVFVAVLFFALAILAVHYPFMFLLARKMQNSLGWKMRDWFLALILAAGPSLLIPVYLFVEKVWDDESAMLASLGFWGVSTLGVSFPVLDRVIKVPGLINYGRLGLMYALPVSLPGISVVHAILWLGFSWRLPKLIGSDGLDDAGWRRHGWLWLFLISILSFVLPVEILIVIDEING